MEDQRGEPAGDARAGPGPLFPGEEPPLSTPGEIRAWQMDGSGAALVRRTLPVVEPKAGEVLVEVAGCGLCHTDLSFLYCGGGPRWSARAAPSPPPPSLFLGGGPPRESPRR